MLDFLNVSKRELKYVLSYFDGQTSILVDKIFKINDLDSPDTEQCTGWK